MRQSRGNGPRRDIEATGPRGSVHMPSVPGSDVDASVIWGTTIQVQQLQHRATLFVTEYKTPGLEEHYLYRELLEECLKNSVT